MTRAQKTTAAVLVAGAFLSVLNQTLMNPALPSVMAELGVGATTAQWLVSGFTLTNAIVVAVSAFLMDKFKTKPLFLSAFAFFFAGSLLAAWGLNFPMLLAGRFLQAVCAGVMIPLSMTMLLRLFPYEKRGSAMGTYSFVIMFAPAIGPAVSGVLTDQVGWHVTFLIMAALAAVIMLIAAFSMKEDGETKDVTLDAPSVLLCVVGLFGLLYGFSLLGHAGTLIYGGFAIAAGGLLLAVFSRRQLKLKTPFLQIGVMNDKQFRTGAIVLMLVSASLTAATITLPLYVQTVRGMSATVSGMIMMPGAIAGAITGFYAGRLSDKFGPRVPAIVGVILVVVGTAGMAFWGFDTPVAVLIAVYCLRYIGLMLANTPVNLWAIGKLPNETLNHGNAVSNTLRQVASTLGTVVMVSVMSLSANLFGGGGLRAELFGIHAAFYLSVVIAVASLIIILRNIRGKKAPTQESAAATETELDAVMNTEPLTLSATDTLGTAVAVFIENRKSGLPIVDGENRLVGYVSSGAIMRYSANQDARIIDANFTFMFPDGGGFDEKAAELLKKNVMEAAEKHMTVVERSRPLSHVCRLFHEQKLAKIPVTENGRFVGTISRIDVIRHLMARLPVNVKPQR